MSIRTPRATSDSQGLAGKWLSVLLLFLTALPLPLRQCLPGSAAQLRRRPRQCQRRSQHSPLSRSSALDTPCQTPQCPKLGRYLPSAPQPTQCSLAPDEVSNSGPASSARPGASPQFVTEGVGQASDRDVQGNLFLEVFAGTAKNVQGFFQSWFSGAGGRLSQTASSALTFTGPHTGSLRSD